MRRNFKNDGPHQLCLFVTCKVCGRQLSVNDELDCVNCVGKKKRELSEIYNPNGPQPANFGEIYYLEW